MGRPGGRRWWPGGAALAAGVLVWSYAAFSGDLLLTGSVGALLLAFGAVWLRRQFGDAGGG